MATVTKRDLNQQTARVLDQARPGEPVVVTEHGVPRWQIEVIEMADRPALDRIERYAE